jgi:hypothetical protein
LSDSIRWYWSFRSGNLGSRYVSRCGCPCPYDTRPMIPPPAHRYGQAMVLPRR